MQPSSFEGQECLPAYAEVIPPQPVSIQEYKHKRNLRVITKNPLDPSKTDFAAYYHI